MSEKAKVLIKLDGKDVEYGSEEHIQRLDAKHTADLAAEKAKTEKAEAERDTMQVKLDASDKAAKKAAEDAKSDEEKKAAERKAAFRKRLRLTRAAMEAMEEEDEEKKLDALDAMTERELMVTAIQGHAGYEKFDGKDKSDAYVEATFDLVTQNVTRADGVDSVVRSAEIAKRTVAVPEQDAAQKARAEMVKRNAEAATKPLGAR